MQKRSFLNVVRAAHALALAAVAWVLSSCGGAGIDWGGQGATGSGRVAMTFLWPERSRLIPAACESIQIVVKDAGGALVDQKTVDRPSDGGASTVLFEQLPVGTLAATATAYPQSGARGVAQASGSVSIEIKKHETARATLTMASTIDRIALAPAAPKVTLGESINVVATAYDASNNVVLMATTKAQWSVGDATVASLTPAGFVATLASLKVGTTDVSFTDSESGKSLVAQLVVQEQPIVVRVSPATVGLLVHGKQQFAAQVDGTTDPRVTWSIDEAFAGTITPDGVYTAPGQPGGPFHIRATSVANPAKSAVATVTVSVLTPAWGSFRGNLLGTGRGSGSSGNGSLRWSVNTGDNVSATAAIGANGWAYVASWDGTLYALDMASGTQRWTYSPGTGAGFASSPAIGPEGTVYVGSLDGKVYAVDGTTGTLKWTYTTGAEVFASPTVASDGTVVVGSYDSSVYALDGQTGLKKWSFATGDQVHGSAGIGADGTVYVGSLDNKVYALDGQTGAKRWEFLTGDLVYASVAVGSGNSVFVGSADGKLYALDASTGAKLWEFLTGAEIRSSAAVGADGAVFFGSNDGSVYALEGATGAPRWEYPTEDAVTSSPAILGDGTVVFGSQDGVLYAVDGTAGTLRWSYTVGSLIESSAAIAADGAAVVGAQNGRVFAIR